MKMEDLFQGIDYPVNNTATISNDVGSSPAVTSTMPTSGSGTASPVTVIILLHHMKLIPIQLLLHLVVLL